MDQQTTKGIGLVEDIEEKDSKGFVLGVFKLRVPVMYSSKNLGGQLDTRVWSTNERLEWRHKFGYHQHVDNILGHKKWLLRKRV